MHKYSNKRHVTKGNQLGKGDSNLDIRSKLHLELRNHQYSRKYIRQVAEKIHRTCYYELTVLTKMNKELFMQSQWSPGLKVIQPIKLSLKDRFLVFHPQFQKLQHYRLLVLFIYIIDTFSTVETCKTLPE